MGQSFKSFLKPVKRLKAASASQLEEWFLKDTHRFTITGLSRSGKSMLFTSLMTVLKYRSEHQYNCLPLLKGLPMELVEKMWIEPIDGYTDFPIDSHIADLAKQQWPRPTEEVYGFKLVVRLTRRHGMKKYLMPYTDVVFEFIDYPGEWITDLPMLKKDFATWSDSAWAQQMTQPQLTYAKEWHQFVDEFDFDVAPSAEAQLQVVTAYRDYLKRAKHAGISMLQPGCFLLSGAGFNWRETGFAPLPAKITSDVTHPWYEVFNKHYQLFLTDWLVPLRESTFEEADKQIILIDLFEGLNHSKQHMVQLKETLSHLAETFVYGQGSWFDKHILNKKQISKVAFVATKMDLIPESQKPAMLSLLKDVSSGAVARFNNKPIEFDHFLVSAIQATDAGGNDMALRYANSENHYIEAEFEPLPDNLKVIAADEHYPVLQAKVPEDYLPRILNGRGLDRLFQFLLD